MRLHVFESWLCSLTILGTKWAVNQGCATEVGCIVTIQLLLVSMFIIIEYHTREPIHSLIQYILVEFLLILKVDAVQDKIPAFKDFEIVRKIRLV